MIEYGDILHKLTKENIRFLICGGLAVNIFGVPRMTADIDILIDFEEKNLTAFSTFIRDYGYAPMLPTLSLESLKESATRKDLVKKRNLIAYSYFHAQAARMSIDVLLDTPLSFNELWNNKVRVGTEKNHFYTVGIDDLIALKKYSNRTQDRSDVILLTRIKNNE